MTTKLTLDQIIVALRATAFALEDHATKPLPLTTRHEWDIPLRTSPGDRSCLSITLQASWTKPSDTGWTFKLHFSLPDDDTFERTITHATALRLLRISNISPPYDIQGNIHP